MTGIDPVTEPHEFVHIKTTDSGSFTAGVARKDGRVVISPVPDRVAPEVISCVVELSAESVDDGAYIWEDHRLTGFGTKVVTLRPIDEETEADE